MLDVERGEDVDAGLEHVLDVLVALAVLEPGRVRVRELVDQAQPRRARQDRGEVHLADGRAAVDDLAARQDLEAFRQRGRLRAPVRLEQADHGVTPVGARPPGASGRSCRRPRPCRGTPCGARGASERVARLLGGRVQLARPPRPVQRAAAVGEQRERERDPARRGSRISTRSSASASSAGRGLEHGGAADRHARAAPLRPAGDRPPQAAREALAGARLDQLRGPQRERVVARRAGAGRQLAVEPPLRDGDAQTQAEPRSVRVRGANAAIVTPPAGCGRSGR